MIQGQTAVTSRSKPAHPQTKQPPKAKAPKGLSQKSLSRMLKKTDTLSDLAYEDQIHRQGFRVALWVLRAYATASPETPIFLSPQKLSALLAYLERCDKHRLEMNAQRTRPPQASEPAFLQQSRTQPAVTPIDPATPIDESGR